MLDPQRRRALVALIGSLATDPPGPGDQRLSPPTSLVRRHLLAPLAYRAGWDRFRRDYVASSLLAELRQRHLDEVCAALTQAGIPVVLLKGAAYLGRIYRDPAERPMSDVDLLVPPAAHARAAQTLRRLGFWQVGSPRQSSRLHHAVGYKRKGISVDLHRSIMQPWRSRIDLDQLWRRKRAMPGLSGVHRLDPVDELVIHLAHIARHELLVPAINYVDAARLLAKVDRAAVQARARSFRLGRGVAAALAMTDVLTDPGRGLPGAEGQRAGALSRRLMPSVDEVLRYRLMWRPLQILRKAWFVDGPVELAGLVAVGVYDGLAHRFRP
ncbi:nucleotidyltransferase family protein [Haliangium sp.]|uniref:nucleotidyltransferase family protein n=1 Tax=Haliangium sp. TaxID=2663208 RepID=UPI003D0D9C00